MDTVLRVEDLRVYYHERGRTVKAVDGVSFDVRRGETFAIVGKSGCGKTTVALAMLNLVPPPGAIESGRIFHGGRDVLQLESDELRRTRGRRISMIFQDAVSGLNPVSSIGSQVEEMVQTHTGASKRDAQRMALEALRRQGLSEPERMMKAYPFQLSGGMCQRVMIAIATVLEPDVVIADEPTSALDVTVQAGILHELNELRRSTGTAIVLITHDLGVVAQMADEMAVMYAGRIVEQGEATALFATPSHPYTAALMAARPRLDGDRRPLQAIREAPPDPADLTGECAFLPRCSKAINVCRSEPWPPLRRNESGHDAACYNPMYHAETDVASSS